MIFDDFDEDEAAGAALTSSIEQTIESISGDCISRDMADKKSAVGLCAKSEDRRKDQAAFRRVAPTLDSDHRLFRYLSNDECEAMQTASAALLRLAHATETAKDIMVRREICEKAERERQDHIDNQQDTERPACGPITGRFDSRVSKSL